MEVKDEMLDKLEQLGFRVFGQKRLYWEKGFGYGKYIRVGDPYYNTNYITFWVNDFESEITDSVLLWAFKTIVEMINMEMIEE